MEEQDIWNIEVSLLNSWSWLGLRDRIPEASELVSKLAPVAFQGFEAIVHPAPGS